MSICFLYYKNKRKSNPTFYLNLIIDNIASDSLIFIHSNGNESTSLVSDGNKKSCVTTKGSKILVQVDIKEMSIVTAIYLTLNGKLVYTCSFFLYQVLFKQNT